MPRHCTAGLRFGGQEAICALHVSSGARRSFWSFGGKKPADSSTTQRAEEGAQEAFSETGSGKEGDEWSAPKDAWDAGTGAPGTTGDDVGGGAQSGLGYFDTTTAFPDSPEAASKIAEAASAAPDAAAAATAAMAASADLGSWPHHLCMQLIESIHVAAGVPYWQAVMLTTLAARVLVLPLMIATTANSLRMTRAAPEIEVLQKKVKELQSRGNANPEVREAAMEEMRVLTAQLHEIYRKHNIRLGRVFYAFLQVPIFISLFFATKEMGSFFPGYEVGGLTWAMDLGARDTSYALPVITWASMQALVELGTGVPPPANSRFNMQHTMRATAIVTLPISMTMPSGVLVYWTTSNVFAILQRLALDSPALRRALDIPLVEDLPKRPAQGPQEVPFEAKEAPTTKEDLQRWSGGGGSDAETFQREREEIVKASKEQHDALKREDAARSEDGGRHDGKVSGSADDRRP